MAAISIPSFSDTIVQVLVEGTVHVDPKEVLEVVQTRAGDDLSSPAIGARIRDDFRAIYALGFFTDLVSTSEPTTGGFNLIWQVVEKPTIQEIRYEGNAEFKAKRLNKEIEFTGKERVFFDEQSAETLRKKVLDFYIKKSFPNTEITWRTEKGEKPSSVILVFQVKEGKRLPVKKITFEGNSVIPDKALKKVMQTKESFWIIVKHNYDDSMLQEDLKRIREVGYYDIGYLDAKAVLDGVTEEDGGLTIKIKIEEGQPYTVGNITIVGNTIFSDDEILKNFSMRPGDQFSYGTLVRDRVEMMNVYRGQGYLDAYIGFSLENRDTANHVVNIPFQVEESSRKNLGKVEIQGVITLDDGTVIPTQQGEFRTKDFVIKRELRLKEGEPLDWTKVIESDRRLVNLDFFKTRGIPIPGQVNLDPGFQRVPTSDPTVENLLLQLEEKETGMLTFGAGISTTFGPSVFATLTERNLFGYGIRGSITGEYGELRDRLALNLYEPHLFNSDYSLDLDVYYLDQQGYGGRRFDEQRIGSNVTIGKELNDELTLLLGLKGEVTDLSPDVGGSYALDPTTIPKEFNLGNNTTTSISFGYAYDTRDFKVDPQNGIYSRSMLEVAGLTDNEYIKLKNLVNYFMPVYDRLILALSGEMNLGYAYGSPGYIPMQERYFVGGANSIRGFDEGGIGNSAVIRYQNIDGGFRTYLGGESAFIGNVELRYPITEMFQVVSFVDMGSVWPKIEDVDPSDFRFSTGAGLRVKIPGMNALIRVDLAVPIRKFDEDDTQFFHFSFGQSF